MDRVDEFSKVHYDKSKVDGYLTGKKSLPNNGFIYKDLIINTA